MMACGLSKSLGFSSSLKQQQGIVTILGTGDCNIPSNTSSALSLRRTFSADLSSKNWVSQNGLKRISSSEKLRTFGADSPSSGDEEETRSGFDIWAQIQDDKNKEEEIEPGQSDVWSSILSDKKKVSESSVVPPPYVHPLMKRASSLSEKSLEICTESLGSETGCEGFSWHASSSETEEDAAEIEVLSVTVTKEEEETEVVEVEQEPITVPNHTPCITVTELPRGSFPPPIRSLASQSGSAALHMKTRRDNGRLVLEAVSMPSHNNFSAKRQDGHLLLTFAEISDEEDETDELQWVEDEEEEEEEAQDEFAYRPSGLQYKLPQKSSEPISVHRLVAAHKPIGVPKRNSRWPATDEFETKSDVVHSLPPRPRVAQLARSMKPPSTVDDTVGAACFNTCDYSWKPTNTEIFGQNIKNQFQAQNYVQKSFTVGQESWTNGCKERRRSLLSMEAFCIATS
ncbi:hypothetical protein Rs2_33715 [Raphanus sativus]|uniref:Protein FAF-like, chloroplastic n=1 Tax=Raphanus sativus TaxID=3726 RepID=A0A6J0K988_RAPSA|nr:protein FAF-like, chloroplastic [Raphanus sativus]KAJ4883622.1 hypothetical protein Rs2_33715 [Raphanus sativus]